MSDAAPHLDALAARMSAVSEDWWTIVRPVTNAAPYVGAELPTQLAIGIEAIREGWLLHRGASRIAPGASSDLALLLGDWCYACGLSDVTEHGVLEHVGALAELVAELSVRADETIDALEPRWRRTLDAITDSASASAS